MQKVMRKLYFIYIVKVINYFKYNKYNKMKIEKLICDVDNCITNNEDVKSVDLQVIFETNQTDGRSCKPYLSNEKVDLCTNCRQKILDNNYLHAYGAQGHNTYYFKKS